MIHARWRPGRRWKRHGAKVMLVIRKEQMAAFSTYVLTEYTERVVRNLRREFPRQTRDRSDEHLRELVEKGIRRAEGYGVTDESDLEQYVDRMLVYGEDFDTRPETAWAGAILREVGLTGSQRMTRIGHYEVFTLRHQGR